MADSIPASQFPAGAQFRTTHWSAVVQAGRGDPAEAGPALDELCRIYWCYRLLLREEIARTVASPDDVEAELRDLFAAFRG